MNLAEDIRIGERAAQLLQDEVLVAAFANIETDAMKLWRESKAADTEGREKIWLTVRAADAVKLELDKMAQAGQFAKAQSDHDNSARQFAQRQKEEAASRLGVDVSMIKD